MQADNFKPAGGQKALKIIGSEGPMGYVPSVPQKAALNQFQQQDVSGRSPNNPVSAKTQPPQGAQEVRLAGAAPHLGATPSEGIHIPPRPSAAEGKSFVPHAQMGQTQQFAPQQPRPFLHRQDPTARSLYRVVLHGVGPDGTPLSAAYEAEFPSGSQLSGAPEVYKIG